MKYLISLIIIISSIIWFSFAENFPYNGNFNTTNWEEMLIWKNSSAVPIAKKYLWSAKSEKHPIAYYISTVINYFLWLLAFFTFLVLLTWISMTFFWKSNEWIKKWKKYIKISTIVIIVIWVSWLISMFIFSIYNSWIK